MSFNRCFGAVVYAGFVVGWGGFCWAQIAIALRNDVRNAIALSMAKSRETKLSGRESPCVLPQKPTIARYQALPGNADPEALPPLISQLKGERTVGGV